MSIVTAWLIYWISVPILLIFRLIFIKFDNGEVTLSNVLWTLIFSFIPLVNTIFIITFLCVIFINILSKEIDTKIF